MLPAGCLPILDPTLLAPTPLTQAIEAVLEAELACFIFRDRGKSLEDFAASVRDLLELRSHMDFGLLLQPPDAALTKIDTLAAFLAMLPAEGISGLHLDRIGPPLAEIRRRTGDDLRIGLSVENFVQARKAEEDGADYAVFGPVFAPGPSDDEGLAALEETCRSLALPVYAAGGLNAGNLVLVKDAGACGFCVESRPGAGADFEHELAKLAALWEMA